MTQAARSAGAFASLAFRSSRSADRDPAAVGLTALGVWQVAAPGLEARSDRADRSARPCPARRCARARRMAGHLRSQRRLPPCPRRRHWLTGRDTLVQAVTALGGGYWVMTPLRTDAGFVILINRGFVPSDYKPVAGRRRASAPRYPDCCASPSPKAVSCGRTILPPIAGTPAISPPSPGRVASPKSRRTSSTPPRRRDWALPLAG